MGCFNLIQSKEIGFLKPISLSLALFLNVGLLKAQAYKLVNSEGFQVYRFDVEMNAEQQKLIGRPVPTKLQDISFKLFENETFKQQGLVQLTTRGQSTLKKFSRKNFSIHLHKTDNLPLVQIGHIQAQKFILSAGAQDALLIKNRLGYSMLASLGLMYLPQELVEVRLNNESQGLYMLTQDVASRALSHYKVDGLFRRRYNDEFEEKAFQKDITINDKINALENLNDIHFKAKNLKGQARLNFLTSKMNLTNYLKWLAFNFIVKNGDYSDEVFFTFKKTPFNPYYIDVFPWDLDDSFNEKMHLQTLFSMPNALLKKESQNQLIYNYESRLDRLIVSDEVTLLAYFNVLEEVANLLTDELIDSKVNQLREELLPYLGNENILKAGFKDEAQIVYDPIEIISQFQQYKEFLQNRRNYIKEQVAKKKAEGLKKSVLDLNIFEKGLLKISVPLMRKFSR